MNAKPYIIFIKLNGITMPDYRRHYFPNSYIFITTVTFRRLPLFLQEENILLFNNTLLNVQQLYSFVLYAYVLMPDHFHWIIQLPNNFNNFSKIVQSFKRNFTLNYKKANHINTSITLWQKRFWDHVIRNEQDLQNHVDYIHWNPVKHNVVEVPSIYKFSSFSKFVDQGFYCEDWGTSEIPHTISTIDSE
jgi:putative transposase